MIAAQGTVTTSRLVPYFVVNRGSISCESVVGLPLCWFQWGVSYYKRGPQCTLMLSATDQLQSLLPPNCLDVVYHHSGWFTYWAHF